MDPRKEFVCINRRHVINDRLRPWGRQSPCPVCEWEDFQKKCREIDRLKNKEQRNGEATS